MYAHEEMNDTEKRLTPIPVDFVVEQGLKEHELEIIGSVEPAQFDAFPALSRLWNAFLFG